MMNESIMPNSQSNEGKDPKHHEPKHVNVSFPQRLRDEENAKKFKKFLEIFKKLEINIPFIEALENMPAYTKFMKQVLASERKLHGAEILCLTENCSALLTKRLPPKLKEPGSFFIPCDIGGLQFGRALCDLGALVNLMLYAVFKKLNGGQLKPTSVSLQLADHSIKFSKGIIEDVIVKIDKLYLPADFIVLDMEEDEEMPIILGRPFLATGRALLTIKKGS
ncbi:hypothetical protein ACH5RR_026009 [Cinchona calisaya]|uniref:Uncharacterized protein n=1 Tax=Cinchona calisaya TaxID=153742 RepID=A0ABD2Z4H6_9GENT